MAYFRYTNIMESKLPILLSGLQPSGKLHIGNYLGMLKHSVQLQNSNKYKTFFFIADYHSLTEDFNSDEKKEQILELMTSFMAVGLDPSKSTLFLQSEVSQHAELMWILSSLAPMGDLRRMTQFKDKSNKQSRKHYIDDSNIKNIEKLESSDELEIKYTEEANVGLFTYPILMAADIILYNVNFVPVGDDQLQHLELARTLVRKFNKIYGETFIEPKSLLSNFPRIMSLTDPNRKMSKSEPKGCLFLTDTEELIHDKIKKAVTDSGSEVIYDEEKKPALANLLKIWSGVTDKTINQILESSQMNSYSKFKEQMAIEVAASLAHYREKYSKLIKDEKHVLETFKVGTEVAKDLASKKLRDIKQKIGFICFE